MTNPNRRLLPLLSATLALCVASQRAEAQAVPTDEGWRFQLTPYFWAAGVKGDVQIRRLPSLEVDASFSDIIDRSRTASPWRSPPSGTRALRCRR